MMTAVMVNSVAPMDVLTSVYLESQLNNSNLGSEVTKQHLQNDYIG